MAGQIVEDIRAAGGYMTREDLAAYKVREIEPIRTQINEFTVLTTPAPSSGALMSLALKILAEGKWNAKRFSETPDRYFHEYIESMKLASAPSTFLSDPRFNNITKQVSSYKYIILNFKLNLGPSIKSISCCQPVKFLITSNKNFKVLVKIKQKKWFKR